MPQLVAEDEREETYIAMEMVGRSLENVRKERHFSALTIAQLGAQLVTSFEALHNSNYIHRDVKCDNLALSLDPIDPRIYIIDFGVATRYKINGMHIRYEENCPFVGNLTFCSLNVLQGIRASRRDDLESIAYILIYLFRNSLPWSQINSEDFLQRAEQVDIKLSSTSSQLCRGLEPEYKHFMDYCRALKYEEIPDYKFAKEMFMQLASRIGFHGDWEYDWMPRAKKVLLRSTKAHRRSSLQLLLSGKDSTNSSPGQLLTALHSSSSTESAGSSSSTPLTQQTAESGLHIVGEEPSTPLIEFQHSIEGVRHRLTT